MRIEKKPLFFKNYYYTRRYECSFRQLARKFVKPTMLVLDAGCGKRSVIGEEKLKTKSTVGAEISYEDIKLNLSVDYKIVANLEYLPLKNEHFDLIICRNVIEHLKSPNAIFKELQRVLKTERLILMRTPNIYNPIMFLSAILPSRMRFWVKRNIFHDKEGDTFPTFYKCNSMGKMLKTFMKLGLKLEFKAYDGLMAYFNFSTILLTLIVLYEKITDIHWLRWQKMWIIASFKKINGLSNETTIPY